MSKQLTPSVPVTDVHVQYTDLLGSVTDLTLTFPGRLNQRQVEDLLRSPQLCGWGHNYCAHFWRNAAVDSLIGLRV